MRDIIEHKRAEDALRESERLVTKEMLRQRNRELHLLHQAGQTLNSSLELDQVLVLVLEEMGRRSLSCVRHISYPINLGCANKVRQRLREDQRRNLQPACPKS